MPLGRPSKKAFFADGDFAFKDKLLKRLNSLDIGPGGLGGKHTVLDASCVTEPTHIAGLPVAVTINCWADRKCSVVLEKGEI